MSTTIATRAMRQSFASTATFARCSRTQYLRLRAQNQAFRPAVRGFSAGARVWEKRYTEDHEWIELSTDGKLGVIGISAYAAKALGDVVYVELPAPDVEVNAGDSIGAVESVKSASDILTPVSGKIVKVNQILEDTPGTINRSPEAEGWLAEIEVKDKAEVESLMDAGAYKKFTEEAEGDH